MGHLERMWIVALLPYICNIMASKLDTPEHGTIFNVSQLKMKFKNNVSYLFLPLKLYDINDWRWNNHFKNEKRGSSKTRYADLYSSDLIKQLKRMEEQSNDHQKTRKNDLNLIRRKTIDQAIQNFRSLNSRKRFKLNSIVKKSARKNTFSELQVKSKKKTSSNSALLELATFENNSSITNANVSSSVQLVIRRRWKRRSQSLYHNMMISPIIQSFKEKNDDIRFVHRRLRRVPDLPHSVSKDKIQSTSRRKGSFRKYCKKVKKGSKSQRSEVITYNKALINSTQSLQSIFSNWNLISNGSNNISDSYYTYQTSAEEVTVKPSFKKMSPTGYSVAAFFLLFIGIFGIFNNIAVLLLIARNKQVRRDISSKNLCLFI